MRREEELEMTKRIEVAQAPAPLEAYARHFDPVFSKSNQREGFRHYLEGLLLPSERHKTLTGLVNTEPGVGAQLPRPKTAIVSLPSHLGSAQSPGGTAQAAARKPGDGSQCTGSVGH
jgi:hypothetical protein